MHCLLLLSLLPLLLGCGPRTPPLDPARAATETINPDMASAPNEAELVFFQTLMINHIEALTAEGARPDDIEYAQHIREEIEARLLPRITEHPDRRWFGMHKYLLTEALFKEYRRTCDALALDPTNAALIARRGQLVLVHTKWCEIYNDTGSEMRETLDTWGLPAELHPLEQ